MVSERAPQLLLRLRKGDDGIPGRIRPQRQLRIRLGRRRNRHWAHC
jgi:hypothetical protein